MCDTVLTKAIDRYVALEMRVIDRFNKEFIEPLGALGNPERLVGKKYEEWMPEDFQGLSRIAGPEPNFVSRFIAKKEIAKLEALEAEVK